MFGVAPFSKEDVAIRQHFKENIHPWGKPLAKPFPLPGIREREILGGFFGVYGYKKETLAEIGEAFQIKESAAFKAKDKALEKLRRVCLDGGLGYWMSIRAAIREAQRDCVVGRGDLGRWMEPDGCVGVE